MYCLKYRKCQIVASLILCSTISSSYSSLDPLCYDHQLTGLYLVRQLTINSLLIRQYIQSITSTQPNKISSLTEVTLTQPVNVSSLHRSADVPTPFHRLATLVTPTFEFFRTFLTSFLRRYNLYGNLGRPMQQRLWTPHSAAKPDVYLLALVNVLKLLA